MDVFCSFGVTPKLHLGLHCTVHMSALDPEFGFHPGPGMPWFAARQTWETTDVPKPLLTPDIAQGCDHRGNQDRDPRGTTLTKSFHYPGLLGRAFAS